MDDADLHRRYRIIDRHTHTAVTTCDIPAGVRCSGGRRFEFGPLGNLRHGSDTHLRIGTEEKNYLVTIVPATGAVEWHRCNNQE